MFEASDRCVYYLYAYVFVLRIMLAIFDYPFYFLGIYCGDLLAEEEGEREESSLR